ncbi:MAG TPA: ATP-grasp domain-containing protein [Pseudonocardiaceae bacterium]|jgi:biotin carboxylase|nr:ATP-grasp domain-containing protein [Pseudonocardiaceae bacterium]
MARRPTIVLVGQALTFPWLFDAATRAGIDLVVVPKSGATVEDTREAAAKISSVVDVLPLTIDTDPAGALATLVERYRREPFDGIMACADRVVPFVAQAARVLGLVGLTEEAAAAVRDKRSMRRLLREAGLRTPDFVTLHDADQWADALRLQFPVVVKPANGYASLGVIRADNKDELQAAVERTWQLFSAHLDHGPAAVTDGGILIEEYLDGAEISVESLIHHGEVRVCGIAYKGELTGPYFEEVVFRVPAPLPAEVLASVEREVLAAHRAFGVTEGITHTELRLVGGTRPVLVETGARMGGSGTLHWLVQNGTGIDLAADALRIHIGQTPECWTRESKGTCFAASYSLSVGEGGRIARVRGLAEVQADPRVEYVVRTAGPGSVLKPYPDWTGYPAIVMSRHDSDAEAVAFHDYLARTLVVEYEPGELPAG